MTPGMQEAFYERRDEEMTVQYSRNIDYPAHFHECLELFTSAAAARGSRWAGRAP